MARALVGTKPCCIAAVQGCLLIAHPLMFVNAQVCDMTSAYSC